MDGHLTVMARRSWATDRDGTLATNYQSLTMTSLPLNELRHRIRALDEGQLRGLFAHEEAHGNRIPVLELLQLA